MSQIATVEIIYVASSGRQYRAQHVEAKVGWELDDLTGKAKSDMSLREYAIEFTNVNGHKQFIMPTDLETIIVNVVGVREEAWEEPAYDELQKKWQEDLRVEMHDGEVALLDHKTTEPSPEVVAEAEARQERYGAMHRINPAKPVTPDGETTQSIRITWGAKPPVPEQRVTWAEEKSAENTQPIKVLKSDENDDGLSVDDATRIIERVAAGGAVTDAP